MDSVQRQLVGICIENRGARHHHLFMPSHRLLAEQKAPHNAKSQPPSNAQKQLKANKTKRTSRDDGRSCSPWCRQGHGPKM